MACSDRRGAGSSGKSLLIAATGNVNGEIEPCGCRPPWGGLARKATTVKALLQKNLPLLVVDAGDLFFAKPELSQENKGAQIIHARTLVAGFNRIGAHAVTLGENDLAGGLPFLMGLAESAQFAMLSANLADETGQLLFPSHTVVEFDDLKVGLVGVSSMFDPGEGYLYLPALPALEKAVAKVRSQADLVVLLFHGTNADHGLIQSSQVPIDLILRSHIMGSSRDFGRERIPTLQLGSLGKFLNVVEINLRSPGEPLVDLSVPRGQLRYIDARLARLGRNKPRGLPLEEFYADNPRILEQIYELRAEQDRLESNLQLATNTIGFERLILDKSVKDDAELSSLVQAAKDKIGKSLPQTSQVRGRSNSAQSGSD